MPKGTQHIETGTLRHNHFGYVLEMDGGGFWVLEFWPIREMGHLLDQRVTVEGVRAGFNILDIDRIKRANEDWPHRRRWTGWFIGCGNGRAQDE